MKLVKPDEMKKIDKWAIEEVGIPGVVLMENAGRGTVDKMEEEYGPLEYKKIIIVCGKGNNGGDGFVISRCLKKRKADISVFLIGKIKDVKGDARINLEIILNMGIDVCEIFNNKILTTFKESLDAADIIVDAIFGTGFKGRIKGIAVDIIELINDRKISNVSIDVPSGINSMDGSIEGSCVRANLTCTMCLPKRGLYLYPGRDYCGKLCVIDIGTPQYILDEIDVELIDRVLARSILPERPQYGHKGTFGKILILAGSPGFTGAAELSSISALRSGAGLVYLGIPESLNYILEEKVTEVVTIPLPETNSQTLASSAVGVLDKYIENIDVFALGPGIGIHKETRELIIKIIESSEKPIIIDADGLNNLKRSDLKKKHPTLILTPHPGELSRLTGKNVGYINMNRIDIAIELAKEWNVILVLKGAPTVVASPEGRCFVNTTGSSALATAGSGDVLTGIIAGFCAQGVDIFLSSVLGVFIHGLSGDLAAERKTEYSVIAGDVMDKIPDAIKMIQSTPL